MSVSGFSDSPMMSDLTFKGDILKRLGGISIFDFVVLSWSERILADPKLKSIYGTFDLQDLIMLKKEILVYALAEINSSFNRSNVLTLRYYRLFECGLNESHFDLLMEHLEVALRDSWVEENIVEETLSMVNELRSVFQSGHSRIVNQDTGVSLQLGLGKPEMMKKRLSWKVLFGLLKDPKAAAVVSAQCGLATFRDHLYFCNTFAAHRSVISSKQHRLMLQRACAYTCYVNNWEAK